MATEVRDLTIPRVLILGCGTIFVGTFAIAFLGIPWMLYTRRHLMSNVTLSQQKKLLLILVVQVFLFPFSRRVQTGLPAFFVATCPVVIIFISYVQWDIQCQYPLSHSSVAFAVGMTMWSLHPMSSALFTIYMTRPYRELVQRWLSTLLVRRTRNVDSVSPVTLSQRPSRT